MKWFNKNDTERQQPKLGLALSGGATRGMAHIGVLKVLQEANIRPAFLAGTSIGALVAAFQAFDIPIDEMYDQAKEMSWTSISTFSPSRAGFLSNRVIGEIIERHIGDVNIEDANTPLAIVATDIHNGDKIILRKGNLATAVMASSSIPGIFTPVEIDGRKLVDGFLVENVPVSPLQEMGADVILGVSLSTLREYREPSGMINILMNAFEIAVDENVRMLLKNVDLLITPALGDIAIDDEIRLQALFDEGYAAAQEKITVLSEILRKKEKKLNRGFWHKLLLSFK